MKLKHEEAVKLSQLFGAIREAYDYTMDILPEGGFCGCVEESTDTIKDNLCSKCNGKGYITKGNGVNIWCSNCD